MPELSERAKGILQKGFLYQGRSEDGTNLIGSFYIKFGDLTAGEAVHVEKVKREEILGHCP